MDTILPDRSWLHIHIVNGDLYVFTDDAHWKDNKVDNWDAGFQTSFDALDKDCFVGTFEDLSYTNQFGERRVDIRIPLKKYGPVKYGKFGFPYQETL